MSSCNGSETLHQFQESILVQVLPMPTDLMRHCYQIGILSRGSAGVVALCSVGEDTPLRTHFMNQSEEFDKASMTEEVGLSR